MEGDRIPTGDFLLHTPRVKDKVLQTIQKCLHFGTKLPELITLFWREPSKRKKNPTLLACLLSQFCRTWIQALTSWKRLTKNVCTWQNLLNFSSVWHIHIEWCCQNMDFLETQPSALYIVVWASYLLTRILDIFGCKRQPCTVLHLEALVLLEALPNSVNPKLPISVKLYERKVAHFQQRINFCKCC